VEGQVRSERKQKRQRSRSAARLTALAAAAAAALPHPVVNVASGTGVPSRTLVGQLVAVSGRQVTVREDAAGSARSPALSWQQADITRAARDLGWRPRRDLADAVRDVWEGTCLV
jgi:nucleoside-diphosphate-sugar epimerase